MWNMLNSSVWCMCLSLNNYKHLKDLLCWFRFKSRIPSLPIHQIVYR